MPKKRKNNPPIPNAKRPRSLQRRKEFLENPESPDFPSMLEKLALALVLANRPDLSEGPAGLNEAAVLARKIVKIITDVPNRGRSREFEIAMHFKAWNTPTGGEDVVARSLEEPGEWIESTALYKANKDIFIKGEVAERLERATANLPEPDDENARARLTENFDTYADYIWQSAVHRVNDSEEEEMLRDMQEISGILEKWNIRVETDPVKLGLAALMKPSHN